MKLAFAGKGGVGKTTLAAIMIRLLTDESRKVLAIDADPNSNLAEALGFQKTRAIKPIAEMKDLIYERMEIKGDPKGSFYKLNPKVSDIPEKFVEKKGNTSLIVMGTVDSGGSGCVCPESTFLRELLKHLVLNKDEDIIMDMEAGLEHLGRSTAISMDCLLAVSEPTGSCIETAKRLEKLASDLKMRTYFIGNKIQDERDEEFLYENLERDSILGMVSYHEALRRLSQKGSVMDIPSGDKLISQVKKIMERLRKSEI